GKLAAGWLRQAIDADPCNWRAIYFLGLWHLEEKRFPLATRFLREASTLARDTEPLAASLWFHLGLALASQDLNVQAAAAYRHSMEIDPARSEAANNLAVLYIETEQWDEA